MFRLLFAFFLLMSSIPVVFAVPNALSDLQSAIIQEDYKKAADLAKALLEDKANRADRAEIVYYLGLSYLRLGDYPQAYAAFKKVVGERPAMDTYDKAYVGLIDSLYMQGFYENALKEATYLMSKRKDSESMSLIYLKAARSNLKLARWTKARDFLQKIISDYPDSFEADVAKKLLDEQQYFAVQVGAFLEKSRAESLVGEIIQRKEYAYIVETTSPDGKAYYRVRVGQLKALKDAQELESKLSGLGYPTLIYP